MRAAAQAGHVATRLIRLKARRLAPCEEYCRRRRGAAEEGRRDRARGLTDGIPVPPIPPGRRQDRMHRLPPRGRCIRSLFPRQWRTRGRRDRGTSPPCREPIRCAAACCSFGFWAGLRRGDAAGAGPRRAGGLDLGGRSLARCRPPCGWHRACGDRNGDPVRRDADRCGHRAPSSCEQRAIARKEGAWARIAPELRRSIFALEALLTLQLAAEEEAMAELAEV